MTLSEALDIARKAKPKNRTPEQHAEMEKSRASSHEELSTRAAALNKSFDALSANAGGIQKQLGEIRRGIAILRAHSNRSNGALQ